MKKSIVGFVFLLCGLFFISAGLIYFFIELENKDERIYTDADIVRIEEYEANDPELGKEYVVYVSFYYNNDRYTAKLNTYNHNYYIGKTIDIYFYSNDLDNVYSLKTDYLMLLIPLSGIIAFIIGIVLTKNILFKKRKMKL